MSSPSPGILLIGYGNPGRLDDGLGPALAAMIEAASIQAITVEAGYQLTVEDAVDVSQHDVVIFADAAVQGKEPFFFNEIRSKPPASLSSHRVSAEGVLFYAESMFHAKTRAYLLGIRGYEFNGFGERLSERAKQNLDEAFRFTSNLIADLNRP